MLIRQISTKNNSQKDLQNYEYTKSVVPSCVKNNEEK